MGPRDNASRGRFRVRPLRKHNPGRGRGGLGSIFYAPFKGLIQCPAVGLVAAGVTYAATGGQKETPEYLLRVGCTGTYFISPGMVQGQEAFRTYDKP